MKYFIVFNHTSAYTEYMASEDAVIPNVSYCYEDNKTYITTEPPEEQYRWVDMDPVTDYFCDGETYTKYYKQKKQESDDAGQTWTDVDPPEYRRGGVAEELSTDCGYVPPQYRWVNLDPSIDWYCDIETYTKYYKQQKEVSYDGGETWEYVVPAEYQQGGVAEVHSTDCGYVPATLAIEGALSVSAETCQYRAIGSNVSDVTTAATWSIVSGSEYATINSNNGEVTILTGASESQVTIQAVYETLTATTTVTLTYLSGSTSETTTEIITDESGNTTTVTTIVTENEDGSSSETVQTVITDESGNTVGSSESNTNTNADGSYTGNTVNYDANGDPVDGVNVSGDTDSNVSTQTVEFDETGGTVVTGYDIDTSENPEGVKEINGEEVNTEFYAFDTTHAFELMLHFYYDPAKQNVKQATVLNAKKTAGASGPWPGFDLRRNGETVNLQYGVQFSSGNQTRNNITMNADHIFKIKVNYDPTVTNGNTFVMYDMINNRNIFTGTGKFKDDESLKYIKITIGCSLDENEQPERRAVMDVYDFYVKRV